MIYNAMYLNVQLPITSELLLTTLHHTLSLMMVIDRGEPQE